MDDSCQEFRLYYQMQRIRLVEERIAQEYSKQQMRCPVHLCIGQEAIAAGVCNALTQSDLVMSTHRSHGHYLAKGGDLNALIAELYGRETGCCEGKGGSMHTIDLDAGFAGAVPIVSSILPIAVGTAFSAWQKGEDRVSVVFFGDGATEEGVFHECLNFAQMYKLPILFVCENNFFSVYSPLNVRRPKNQKINSLAAAHGVTSRHGDGNDVEAVYETARQAISDLRAGNGPAFLEFETYRWLEHCGPNNDDHLGYRSLKDVAAWRERCPVLNYEKVLADRAMLRPDQTKQIEAQISSEIDAAFEFATSSPFPDKNKMLSPLYA